jgi:isoquinoline 1-oxidoreductase beta subunit
MDVKLPGLLTAMIERPPVVGGKVKSVDDKAAKAVKGVRAVLQVPQGVAVIATGYWAAKTARAALKIEWDHGPHAGLSSAGMVAQFKEMAKNPGAPAKKAGDADAAFAAAAKKVEATYEFPFLAHAPMEPLNCTVQIRNDGVEIWTASQFQTIDQATAAAIAGFKPEQVKINTLLAGGSFGRRANLQADYIAEAVAVAKAAQGAGIAAPIRTVRTREDDTRAHYYRPIYVHRMQGGVDAEGKAVAWAHRIVGQSILSGTPFEPAYVKNGVDFTSVEGAATLPYEIPNLLVDLHSPKSPVPILWWRVVGASHTVYAVETFIDMLAKEAGKDALEFRLALMAKHPRHIGVLKLAAEKGDWGKPMPAGRGRGIAVTEAFNTYVAQVAEVTVKPDGAYKVDRVVCAVDCGVAVNPDVIKAQMEGGIGFGLGAAMFGAITMKDGRVEQSNFHDYRVLRMEEMPKVETHIVASTAKPTGVGEPGVAPVAAAVANAIAAATGKRLAKLPFGEKV